MGRPLPVRVQHGCLHGVSPGCACPAGPARPRGCAGQSRCPHLPARPGPAGPARGHEPCMGRRTKPAALPTGPADFLLGVFTSFPKRLPMGTSQTETAVRLAVPAGSDTSSPFACWSCCLQRAQLRNGDVPTLWSPFQVDALGEAEVCLPLQIGSKPAEQLRY